MTHDFGNTGHGLGQAQKCGSKVSLNQLVGGISMDYWCKKVFDSLWTEKYITSGMLISTGRGRRNRWPAASIFTVGPVKLNKDRPAGPVDILGPLGPATFVSSVSFNID